MTHQYAHALGCAYEYRTFILDQQFVEAACLAQAIDYMVGVWHIGGRVDDFVWPEAIAAAAGVSPVRRRIVPVTKQDRTSVR